MVNIHDLACIAIEIVDDNLSNLVKFFGEGRAQLVNIGDQLGCHVEQFNETGIRQIIWLVHQNTERSLVVQKMPTLQVVRVLQVPMQVALVGLFCLLKLSILGLLISQLKETHL